MTRKTTPLYSVITISLNHINGLKRSQQSLESQTCRDFEWIVIDGGSNDGTVEFLSGMDARWVSEPDRGIYDAMNKGIERAQGDYLLFLNAGDTLADSATLQKIKDSISGAPDFIYGDALESAFYKRAKPHEKILSGMFTHHQAMLYRREALQDLRYDDTYKIAADYKFTAAFLRRAQNILYCPFPVCGFEPGGISQQHATMGRVEQFRARRELKLCPLPVAAAIYAAQTMLMVFRSAFPGLYWRLKNSPQPKSAS